MFEVIFLPDHLQYSDLRSPQEAQIGLVLAQVGISTLRPCHKHGGIECKHVLMLECFMCIASGFWARLGGSADNVQAHSSSAKTQASSKAKITADFKILRVAWYL